MLFLKGPAFWKDQGHLHTQKGMLAPDVVSIWRKRNLSLNLSFKSNWSSLLFRKVTKKVQMT